MPRQIGWSQASNLIYNINRTLDKVTGGSSGSITTTTTTTVAP